MAQLLSPPSVTAGTSNVAIGKFSFAVDARDGLGVLCLGYQDALQHWGEEEDRNAWFGAPAKKGERWGEDREERLGKGDKILRVP